MLGNGRYCAPEIMRKFSESVTLSTLIAGIRKRKPDSTFLDIDALAQRLATKDNLPFATDTDKRKAYIHLADHILSLLEKLLPQAVPQELLERMQKLEEENKRLMAQPSRGAQ